MLVKVTKHFIKKAGTHVDVLVLFAEEVPVLVLEAGATLHGGQVARHVVDDVVSHVAAVLLMSKKKSSASGSSSSPTVIDPSPKRY